MKNPTESKLVAAFAAGFILSGVWSVALAKDRVLRVLESSVVVSGADVTIGVDCEAVTRIAPIADQRPAQLRKLPDAACKSLKAALLANAKADQGLE